MQAFDCILEIVKRPSKWFRVPPEVDLTEYLREKGIDTTGGFKVLPRRWVVERTLAWINRYRRLSKDYEYCCEISEAMLFAAMTRTMPLSLRVFNCSIRLFTLLLLYD
jgi:transposase